MDEADATRQTARVALVTLRARVDAHFEQAMARSPEQFQCAAGCDSCCHRRFGVFEIEADRLREALSELDRRDPALRERVRHNAVDPDHADHCAMLVDGRCAVYEARPLICRTHGLPTAVVDPDGSSRLDVCPLNFRTEDPPRASLLAMSAVNEPLAVMAEMYAQGGKRVDLAKLAAAHDPEKNSDAAVDPSQV